MPHAFTRLKTLVASLLTSSLLGIPLLPTNLPLVGLKSSLSAGVAMAEPTTSGYGPQRYHDGLQYGTGVYFAPYRFTVYSQPDEKSPVIAEYHWSRQSGIGDVAYTTPNGGPQGTSAENVFICFYPGLDVAMMPVLSENGQGWAEVVYNQSTKKSGWVRLKPAATEADQTENKSTTATKETTATASAEPSHFGVYQTWLEFMKLNARTNGIYWLSGVSSYNRSLRTKNEDTATLLQVTLMRSIKVRFVRGNWLLVEALDFEHNTPIGWVRWRDDDGNLMVFPNVSHQRTPIVTTN